MFVCDRLKTGMSIGRSTIVCPTSDKVPNDRDRSKAYKDYGGVSYISYIP